MWARINAGLVAELIEHDPAGYFHPDVKWIAVPEALRRWVKVGWKVAAGELSPPSLQHLVDQMAVKLADRRWDEQTAGVGHGGHVWHSDAEGRASINESLTLAAEYERLTGQTWSTRWKAKSGFVTVDRAALVAAGLAVGEHVQACFNRESEILQAITDAAAAPGATAASVVAVYDSAIGEGWPA